MIGEEAVFIWNGKPVKGTIIRIEDGVIIWKEA